jgi:inner membrane protein
MFKTHLVFSILIGLLILSFIEVPNKYLFLGVVCFGAVFVDIDEVNSKIGRRTRPLSDIINFLFNHRGFFHTIYPPLIVFGLLAYFNYLIIGFAFLIGYLSHLFIDMFNIMGISMFKPLHNMHVKGFVRTGGFLEYVLFFVFIVLIFIVAFKIY